MSSELCGTCESVDLMNLGPAMPLSLTMYLEAAEGGGGSAPSTLVSYIVGAEPDEPELELTTGLGMEEGSMRWVLD